MNEDVKYITIEGLSLSYLASKLDTEIIRLHNLMMKVTNIVFTVNDPPVNSKVTIEYEPYKI